MSKILFSERQHARWAYFFTATIIVLLTLAYYFGWGTRPIPTAGYVVLLFTFVGVFFLFCKMDTSIDGKALRIRYGLFGFTKDVPLSDIKEVRQVKYPFYYGAGIRMTPKGTLYSVNFAKSVELILRNNERSVSVGTAKPEEMIRVLQQMIADNV